MKQPWGKAQCLRGPSDGHSTYNDYCRGCRCPEARNATRLYYKRRREGRQGAILVDATGTHRRLQALCAMGYSMAELSRMLGRSERYLAVILDHKVINPKSAALVAALYDAHSHIPGPSNRAKLRALKKGWKPPLAWDNIDDPSEGTEKPPAAGSLKGIDMLKRVQACQELKNKGMARKDIAREMGLTESQVRRALLSCYIDGGKFPPRKDRIKSV